MENEKPVRKKGRPRVERLKVRTNISIDGKIKLKGQRLAHTLGCTFSHLIETMITEKTKHLSE